MHESASRIGAVEERMSRPTRRRVSTEMASIILTLTVSVLAFLFFKYAPDYTPEQGQTWIWSLPGWLSLGYITIQLWLLLDTALRVRAAGIIGAVLAIAPVMTGIVIGVLWVIGYLQLSGFQLNALAMLIATGIVEFVSTLWVRHVLLQRGMTVVPDQDVG
jgi:hypothetical protein